METILNESLNNYFGYPKPSYSIFNGTDEKMTRSVNDYNSGNSTGYIKSYWNVTAGFNIIFNTAKSSVNTNYAIFQVVNGQVRFLLYKAGVLNQVKSSATISYGWHLLEIISNGTAYTMKVDGSSVSFTTTVGNNGDWFADMTSGCNIIGIGVHLALSPTYGVSGGAYVEVDGTNKWILTGWGKYTYDVIGGLHLAYSGTGSKVAYSKSASWHLLQTKGYSLFTKTGELDEYVPYTEAGEPQNPTELVAYTHQFDVAGNLTNYNFAPSVIDFNPASLLDTKLSIFDKSNTTIHISTASMLYYNSLAPSEWRNDELKTFTIYSGYFNSGYEGRLFIRIVNHLLIEILNYHTNKTNGNLVAIKTYCGIT